jgi:hypothetical protein
MCVENGMFTVSFLKEGISKVSPGRLSVYSADICSSVDGLMSFYDRHGKHVRTRTC